MDDRINKLEQLYEQTTLELEGIKKRVQKLKEEREMLKNRGLCLKLARTKFGDVIDDENPKSNLESYVQFNFNMLQHADVHEVRRIRIINTFGEIVNAIAGGNDEIGKETSPWK
ncbi:hypothetical protein L2E82_51700 [Cichorium intybus]|nr:hypothetical protein L2E82_51700 [Cichorium intybus]